MTAVEPSCPDGVAADVWAYALRYRPRSLPAETWGQVRPFVLEVAARVAPGTRDAARITLVDTTALWGWAAARHLPLDVEKVLTPDRVARYVDETFRGGSDGTASTTRGRLDKIGRTATRKAPWPGRRTKISRTAPVMPYTEAEITGYRRAAAVQMFGSSRRCLTGVLVLCAGAGAMPGQAARARTDGLVLDDLGRWCVTLDRPDRLVPIVTDYVEDALRLAAAHPGEPWLSPVDRCGDWLGGRLRSAVLDTTLPPMLSMRLRATWTVGRLDAGVPMKTLMRAAGIATGHALTPYLQYTTHDDDTALARPAPTPRPGSYVTR